MPILALAFGALLTLARRLRWQRGAERAVALALAALVGSCQGGADTSPLPGAIFYTADHLGSTAVLTDTAGEVVGESTYDAWGLEVVSTDEPHGFNGKELDAQAGLVYFGARYYDPRLGRFLTVDPAALAPSEQAVQDPAGAQSLRIREEFAREVRRPQWPRAIGLGRRRRSVAPDHARDALSRCGADGDRREDRRSGGSERHRRGANLHGCPAVWRGHRGGWRVHPAG